MNRDWVYGLILPMNLSNTQEMKTVNFTQRSITNPQRTWTRLWLFIATISLIATGLPAYAVTRDIAITAPTTAEAGSKVAITVSARTDAGGGEKIGFFHADYSVDNGLTWTAISYSTSSGSKTSRSVTLSVKEAGTKALIRVRAAFRGGKAGDVDYTGKTIDWDGTWNKWQEPPAKIVSIEVVAK